MVTLNMKAQKATAKNKQFSQSDSLRLVSSTRGGKILALRSKLKLNREVFARMLSVSTRSLATIESGAKSSEAVRRGITELFRVVEALAEVIHPETIGEWITTPNYAFDGLKPLEVIERGEVDRIWQMIFLLRSGVPT